MAGIIFWIIFGAIAGWIASMLMGSNNNLIMDIILGIVGAIVGGWLASALGGSGVTGFNLYSLIVAVIGAVIVIYVGRMFMGRRATP